MLLALALAVAEPAGPADRCATASVRAAPALCEAAIAAERDPKAKAQLLLHRGYALDELHRPSDAIADLSKGLALDPDNLSLLQERAYAFGELAQFDAEIRDLDRAIALQADSVAAFRERAFAGLAVADFEGSYRDASRVAELDPKAPDAHLLKAERALWLQHYDEAAREVGSAEALAVGAGDQALSKRIQSQRAAVLLWRTRSLAPPAERCKTAFETAAVTEPNVIGDCTAAFFAAPTKAKKAEYLTYRSVAWSAGHQDEQRWLVDAEVATALDPSNPDWLVNVAGLYDRVGRTQAALTRVDRALAVKQSYVGFATRASARYNIGDKAGAFADAKRSFEMRPNSVALWVLGDLARDRGDKSSAKLYWMGAWHLGVRDDGLRERLKAIGVGDPDKVPNEGRRTR